jgi:hypothetical protein
MKLELTRLQLRAIYSLALDRLLSSDGVMQWVDIVNDETVTIQELFALITRAVVAVDEPGVETGFRITADGAAITCLKCGMTSYNPNDILHRYCGNCNMFHVAGG